MGFYREYVIGPPPPPGKCWTPSGTLKNDRFLWNWPLDFCKISWGLKKKKKRCQILFLSVWPGPPLTKIPGSAHVCCYFQLWYFGWQTVDLHAMVNIDSVTLPTNIFTVHRHMKNWYVRKIIDQWSSVFTGKYQPTGPRFVWKTQHASLPTGTVGKPRFPLERTWGLGLSCPHWTPMMESIYLTYMIPVPTRGKDKNRTTARRK